MYTVYTKWKPVLHCTRPSVFRWSMHWNSPRKHHHDTDAEGHSFISKSILAQLERMPRQPVPSPVVHDMEPIYGYDTDTSIYKYIIISIPTISINILQDCQNCSKHVSLSHCWHHSSIQLSALMTFVCRSSRAQLSLCQPKPSQCLWSQVANSMANWMRAHGAPMCTLPISCPMVQNVRSRNFYGHSGLALCTNSIKCLRSIKSLRSIKRNTILFTNPSGQNASAFAGRDGGRSRLGAGALESLDVAILARQLSVTHLKWHPHPSHPSHRLNQLQLASQALLHDGPGRLEAVEIGAYF